MPIDPQIPLSAQGIQIGNPFLQAFQAAQQMQLQRQQAAALEEERRAQAELRQQQMVNAQRQAEIVRGTEEALRGGGGVRETTMAIARQHSPGSVPALTEFFDKSEKNKAEIDKLQKDLNDAKLDHMGHMAEGLLKFGPSDQAIQTVVALNKELFPTDAAAIEQGGAQLLQMAPDQRTAWLTARRDAAPYYQAQQQKAAERGPVQVAAGGTLVDASGKPIYTAPEKVTKPASVQEYEFAVAQGYKGT